MSQETRPYAASTPVDLGLPPGDPASLGFDPQRLRRALAVLERAIAEGAFPGAVALVARRGKVVFAHALGHAQTVPVQRAMALDTPFDLASLTKVVALTPLVLTLLEDGALSLDDAYARFVPEFAYRGKAEVTLRQLLAHTSGLPAWLPLYASASSGTETLQQLCDAELAYEPGTQVLYSDLGPILLGLLCERLLGETLDRAVARRVLAPLGMSESGYRPDPTRRARAAATEVGNRFEAAMAEAHRQRLKLAPLTPRGGFRQQLLIGEVHDGNAHHALQGVSGHAGLFGTAADVLRWAQMFLNDGRAANGARLLSPATVAEALSLQTAGLPMARGLGFQLLRKGLLSNEEWGLAPAAVRLFPASKLSFPSLRPYGDLLSGRTAGHTGFTGCSVAIDPERELAIVLCTNRVHPDADRFAIGVIRPRFHNAVAASLVEP